MEGYDETTYGDAFADVYDDWYGDISDVDGDRRRPRSIWPSTGPVLELGVGTGRLAVPLAEAGRRRGVSVTGRRHEPGDARPARRSRSATGSSTP